MPFSKIRLVVKILTLIDTYIQIWLVLAFHACLGQLNINNTSKRDKNFVKILFETHRVLLQSFTSVGCIFSFQQTPNIHELVKPSTSECMCLWESKFESRAKFLKMPFSEKNLFFSVAGAFLHLWRSYIAQIVALAE